MSNRLTESVIVPRWLVILYFLIAVALIVAFVTTTAVAR